MPLSLRFVVPLALALAAIAYAVVPLVDRLTFQWFVRDLDTRGALIAKTAQEPLAELVDDNDDAEGEGAALLRAHHPGPAHLRPGLLRPRRPHRLRHVGLPRRHPLHHLGRRRGAQLGAAARRRAAARVGEPHRFGRRRRLRRADHRARHELRCSGAAPTPRSTCCTSSPRSPPWWRSSPWSSPRSAGAAGWRA